MQQLTLFVLIEQTYVTAQVSRFIAPGSCVCEISARFHMTYINWADAK
jgi:hypothetical protein